MDANEASAALAEFERRQQQTVDAGTAPWPRRAVLAAAAAFVAFGLLIDLEMIWLGAILLVGASAAGTTKVVQLRRTGSGTAVLAAVFVFALGVDVAVQLAVRSAELPLPNTWGAAAAAVTAVLLATVARARS